jgi:hypothetical protein
MAFGVSCRRVSAIVSVVILFIEGCAWRVNDAPALASPNSALTRMNGDCVGVGGRLDVEDLLPLLLNKRRGDMLENRGDDDPTRVLLFCGVPFVALPSDW